MHRLFVAIRPPDAVRDVLLASMGGVSGARWQGDDQLHLTLRFVGEVDRHAAQDVAAALVTVRASPFELNLAGVGVFDSRGSPNAIWAGVAPGAEVAALHKKVDQALVRIGIAPDARAFHPHITLARLGRHAGQVGGFLGSTRLAGPAFEVDGFTLFKSILTRDRAEYRAVEHYRLPPSPI